MLTMVRLCASVTTGCTCAVTSIADRLVTGTAPSQSSSSSSAGIAAIAAGVAAVGVVALLAGVAFFRNRRASSKASLAGGSALAFENPIYSQSLAPNNTAVTVDADDEPYMELRNVAFRSSYDNKPAYPLGAADQASQYDNEGGYADVPGMYAEASTWELNPSYFDVSPAPAPDPLTEMARDGMNRGTGYFDVSPAQNAPPEAVYAAARRHLVAAGQDSTVA